MMFHKKMRVRGDLAREFRREVVKHVVHKLGNRGSMADPLLIHFIQHGPDTQNTRAAETAPPEPVRTTLTMLGARPVPISCTGPDGRVEHLTGTGSAKALTDEDVEFSVDDFARLFVSTTSIGAAAQATGNKPDLSDAYTQQMLKFQKKLRVGGERGREFRRGVIEHLAPARGMQDPVLVHFVEHGPDSWSGHYEFGDPPQDHMQYPVRTLL